MPPWTLVPPKMEFFNFGLEQKLDHHSCVEFNSDSDGNIFNLSKSQLNPSKYPLVPRKMIFFNFGLGKKLDQHSRVEYHGE